MAESVADSARRVGIFGGTFNPPHRGHLLLARKVRDRCSLDRVLWVPNSRSPFKTGKDLAPASDRLAMARAATAGDAGFAVSEIEIRQGGTSYTVETLRKLRQAYPDAAFRLVVGRDQLAGFARWREPEEIVRLAPLIVFPRPGYEEAAIPAGFERHVEFVDAPGVEISATDIRERLRAGRSVRDLVPPAVLEIIAARGLYR